MTDQSLARFTRPHEPDTTELVLSRGERLPAHVVKRIIEALQVATAYMQDSAGSFISVRPQPALARDCVVEYLEKLLNIEVPGRAKPGAVSLMGFIDQERVIQQRDTPLTAVSAGDTGVYSSPREALKPTRRFDKDGAPY